MRHTVPQPASRTLNTLKPINTWRLTPRKMWQISNSIRPFDLTLYSSISPYDLHRLSTDSQIPTLRIYTNRHDMSNVDLMSELRFGGVFTGGYALRRCWRICARYMSRVSATEIFSHVVQSFVIIPQMSREIMVPIYIG